jgi:hypothetical protein
MKNSQCAPSDPESDVELHITYAAPTRSAIASHAAIDAMGLPSPSHEFWVLVLVRGQVTPAAAAQASSKQKQGKE